MPVAIALCHGKLKVWVLTVETKDGDIFTEAIII